MALFEKLFFFIAEVTLKEDLPIRTKKRNLRRKLLEKIF